MRALDETDEMIWWSERTGWGHFYLYDRNGKLKNAITSGPFRASRIVAVDAKNRLLYFLGNAREPGENIYFEHLYRVHLDGTGLTLLDPGPAQPSARSCRRRSSSSSTTARASTSCPAPCCATPAAARSWTWRRPTCRG